MSVSGNPRSRGWFDSRESDAPTISSPSEIFLTGPKFHDGLVMSDIAQRALLSGQELHPDGVVTSRHPSIPRVSHKVPIYLAKRKLGRARAYIGRRAAPVYKTADVRRSGAAVSAGKDYVAADEYGGGRVPVNRIGLHDIIINDDKDNDGETGIQDKAGLTDVKYNGALRTTAHNCRGLKMEHDENGRELGIKDYAKDIHVRKGDTADGKNPNRKSSVSGVPMSFGASGKLEAMEKRSRRLVRNFASYPWMEIDPTVSGNRKRRSLWFDFGNGNELPWETAEYQPPEWKGHCQKTDPNDMEMEKREERK